MENTKDRISVEEKVESSYLEYAVSVIVGRTVPDVRDGLKPVHRRIIYALKNLDALHDGHLKKSARIVGDVIGKYHPHGDTSVYDAMVRLAQDFSVMMPLIEGQGNFGSIDGDSAAAMRYTEAKGTRYLSELMIDLHKDVVDFGLNYDGTLKEPLVLPCAVPNLLINGTTGIAVGMVTSIPSHNPVEVLQACIYLLNNPQASISDLMGIVKGPDFPTGGVVYSDKQFEDIYSNGTGQFKIRGEIEINDSSLIITSIPYGVIKTDIIDKISELSEKGDIVGVVSISDESSKLGIRVVVECQKKANLNIIKNIIIKSTKMEVTFSCNFLAIKNKQPRIYNLKSILEEFLTHRNNVLLRSTRYDYEFYKTKNERLAGLCKILLDLDSAIAIIKKSETSEEAIDKLCIHFEISKEQAQYILDIKLIKLTKTEIKSLELEIKQIQSKLKQLQLILSSETQQKKVILDDIKRMVSQYSKCRATKIISNLESIEKISKAIVIQDLPTNISFSTSGLLKRSSSLANLKNNGDLVSSCISCTTHSLVGCISRNGKFFTIEAHKIPEVAKGGRGVSPSKFFNLKDDSIVGIFEFKPMDAVYVYLVTMNGLVKKTLITEYKRTGPSGITAIKLLDGDYVTRIEVGNSGNVFVLTTSGNIFHYIDDITPIGRASKGVLLCKMKKGEFVADVSFVNTNEKIHVFTDNNNYICHRPVSEYVIKNKNQKIETLKLNKFNCVVSQDSNICFTYDLESEYFAVKDMMLEKIQLKNDPISFICCV